VSEQEEAGFEVGPRFAQILRGLESQEEVAEACRLVLSAGLEPLLEAWRRNYPKVPPRLEDHLKAQSEFTAIMSLAKVLRELAADRPSVQGDIFEQALGQAEEEMGALVDEGALTE